MKKRFYFFSAVLLFFMIFSAGATIFSRPRRFFVLQTKYFDYIFPHGAEQTAYYLAKNGDTLFEKAADYFGLKKKFRIPVAITLDSDELSASYTSTPYNRITVYQAPAKASAFYTDNALLSVFYEAVSEAAASSVRSPFWQFASDFTGMDTLQPSALLNIPAAFMDGVINSSVYEEDGGIMNDGFSLQLLSQAKKDGYFPTWIDAAGSKDTYPSDISRTAYSAFAAYIQQRWGMSAFEDFWKQSGSVHFFTMSPGAFRKAYKISLRQAWKDFEQSVPVPETIDFGEVIFTAQEESFYSNIISSPVGILLYDSSKSNIYSLSKKNKKNWILIATNIYSVSASNDGQFLAISYTADKSNRKLLTNTVQIFDIQKKMFLPGYTNIRNAAFFEEKKGRPAVAGYKTRNNQIQLKVYSFYEEISQNDSFSLTLPEGIRTEGIVPAGTGKLICIYYYKKDCILQTVDVISGTTEFSKLPVHAKDFKTGQLDGRNIISFTYSDGSRYALSKSGYFFLEENGTFNDIYLQQENINGGTNDSCIIDGEIYFSSHLAEFQELRRGNISELTFCVQKKTELPSLESEFSWDNIPESIEKRTDSTDTEKEAGRYLGEFKIKRYKPPAYMFKGTWFPFFPISAFDFTETSLSPGLGATYYTSSDPLETLTGAVSFCAGFIDTSKKTFSFNNDYTLAGTLNSTILPFDMSLSGLWNFNSSGQYNIQAIAGFFWNHFLGMSFHNLSFGIKEMWKCTTTYMDYTTDQTIKKENWPSINEAYNTFSTYFSVNYSNYHQSGSSSFEQRGFEAGASLINIYDPQKVKKENEISTNQITASLSFGLKLPFILPVFGLDNWVICMPSAIYTKWYGENGTSSESYVETLLAGYEIQKGLPGINLYLNRFGIKVGYEINTAYNQLTSSSTDLRNFQNFLNVLANSVIDDYIYINLELGLTPAIGKFSDSVRITAGVQFQMHFRDSRGKVAAIFKMNL